MQKTWIDETMNTFGLKKQSTNWMSSTKIERFLKIAMIIHECWKGTEPSNPTSMLIIVSSCVTRCFYSTENHHFEFQWFIHEKLWSRLRCIQIVWSGKWGREGKVERSTSSSWCGPLLPPFSLDIASWSHRFHFIPLERGINEIRAKLNRERYFVFKKLHRHVPRSLARRRGCAFVCQTFTDALN